MANTISAVFVNTYERQVRHLAQQGITRARPWVMEKSVQSEGHNWERLGEATATEKASGLVETPDSGPLWSRRKSVPVTWHTGDSTEHEDIAQMLVDPNSNILISQAKAMRRAIDEEIISAAVGDSRDGAGDAVAFLPAQNIGDGTSPMSFDIVTEVSEIFLENDVDPEDPRVFFIGPKQARKLLQLTEATSSDYTSVKALEMGYVENWMGYTWVVSTLLQEPDDGEIYCFAMTKEAIGLQVNKDIWSRASEDPSNSYAWRLYTAASYGAIRVEDEKLVRVHLADTL